ncbi:hypothetical protein COU59_00700 [Candidatus Pacearchaeota archaeon CG10_big_fil_rev_8_21_14_0_10_34_12]|nr:MAG: hypothetical protein COU59_00700 [Candidatus Pacearchaeota archaeon CG10_big_fil_rev_8_21_14_0_10_34_12]
MKALRGMDILGNIAILKFSDKASLREKKKIAEKILKHNKSIKTIVEKTGKFSGRLRKQKTRWLAGEKTKEVLYRENGCVFRFNVDETYFSSRLSGERKEIASKIKKGESVLVMFSGVNPYGIVIAKNSKARKVCSIEINKEASKYARLNVELNKLKDSVEIIQGDVKKIVKVISKKQSLKSCLVNVNGIWKSVKILSVSKKRVYDNGQVIPRKFDVIVMPRPQLKDSFLGEAFSLSKSGKRGTRIFYYDFCKNDEIESVIEKIKQEAKKSGKKIKIINKKVAGEIASYKVRLRVDFKVL